MSHRFARKCFFLLILFCFSSASVSQEFSDGLESGVVADDLWQLDKKGDCEISVTDQVKLSGRRALELRSGAGGRCEVVPQVFRGLFGKYRRAPFEEERWYVFSTYLQGPWEAGEKNEIIAQWHGSADAFLGDVGGRGPPLAIRIYGQHFRITYGWDEKFVSDERWIARQPLWSDAITTDRWLTWKIQARWSYKEDGLLRIWLNDELIVDHAGPNTYNDLRGVYLKLGPYHPGFPRTLFLDDVYVGGTAP